LSSNKKKCFLEPQIKNEREVNNILNYNPEHFESTESFATNMAGLQKNGKISDKTSKTFS
jgi:hypothetical protein